MRDVVADAVASGAWSGLVLGPTLAGGHRGAVRLGWRGDDRVVVRRSGRGADSLAWELDLLAHLDAHGCRVPTVVATDDGRRHVDGVLVQVWLDGEPPRGDEDRVRVAAAVARVQRLTAGWPQRPDAASSRDLQQATRGADVELDAMPAWAVRLVRGAWASVDAGEPCVVHGDLGDGNVRVGADGAVGLLDWDEARVDLPWFDLAGLPDPAGRLEVVGRDAARLAALAWEVATCWAPEPSYARRRLDELVDRTDARLTDVATVCSDLVALVEGRDDVHGVALLGSHARGAARPDSDVDLVVLVDDPAEWVRDPGWVDALGPVARSGVEPYGAVTSRRLHLRRGPEVEVGLAHVSWASVPVETGTAAVVRDGCRVLHDPDGHLARLLAAVGR